MRVDAETLSTVSKLGNQFNSAPRFFGWGYETGIPTSDFTWIPKSAEAIDNYNGWLRGVKESGTVGKAVIDALDIFKWAPK